MQFDLLVIGAGPGGYVAAIRAAQLGWKVACVEKEPALGGTCLRIGCIPSKALLDSSHRFEEILNQSARHGIKVAGVELDLPALLKRKDQVVSGLTKGIDHLFKKNNVTRLTGRAEISGPGEVTLTGGKGEKITARHVLIATGSQPASLPGIEWSGDRIGTSTEALAYPEVPKHLVVIGAGAIGLELGSVWRRLGASVTVLEFLDRILPGLDLEIARDAQKLFERQGLKFQLGTRVKAVRLEKEVCRVEVEGAEPITCDRVLVATGRIPHTEGLGLDKVGIKKDARGRIEVNAHFATSAPGFYAIGDVIAGPMLAHKAEEEGIACVEYLVNGVGHVDYNTIPSVVYTHPEIASVGKTEEQLVEQKVEFKKGIFPFRANGRAQAAGDVEGKVKVLTDAKSDRILGVHILGPHAGEMINEASAAMAFGASGEDLARVCHAHPTLSEALKESASAAWTQAIHV